MSYRGDGSPLPGFASQLEVYFKIFGGNVSREEMLHSLKQRRSIFDILGFEGSSTKQLLTHDDREKLKDYTTSIRDIELSLSREEEWLDIPYPEATQKWPPEGMQGEPEIKSMFKMILTAWQADATRVVTYRMTDAERRSASEHEDLLHDTHPFSLWLQRFVA